MGNPQLHVIIPAGGAGTRLWPLSRRSEPKFLLDPLGRGKSLLQETVQRLKPLALTITVVTGKKHYKEVCRQLPELTGEGDIESIPGEILVEPTPRDSMAAIGYAAYVIRERYGDDAIVGSFAADHIIDNNSAFEQSVVSAVEGAKLGYLTTVGVIPTEPSTAFGYIRSGNEQYIPGVYPVVRFVEKPDEDTAKEYVSNGYLWNAGVFVARCDTIANNLVEQLPQMDQSLRRIAADHVDSLIKNGESTEVDSELWDSLTKIAIDFALAEPLASSGKVAVVKSAADLGWSDIGDFAAISEWLHQHPLSATDIDDNEDVIRVKSENSIVITDDACKPEVTALVGVDNVVVVQTKDSLLVVDVDHAQSVKEVVDALALQKPQML